MPTTFAKLFPTKCQRHCARNANGRTQMPTACDSTNKCQRHSQLTQPNANGIRETLLPTHSHSKCQRHSRISPGLERNARQPWGWKRLCITTLKRSLNRPVSPTLSALLFLFIPRFPGLFQPWAEFVNAVGVISNSPEPETRAPLALKQFTGTRNSRAVGVKAIHRNPKLARRWRY